MPLLHSPATGLPENLGKEERGWPAADTSDWSLTTGTEGEEAGVAGSLCPGPGLQTVLGPGAATKCPERELRTLGVAGLGPGAAIKCPDGTEGLRTIAAAVPGLGVATSCRRTAANGDRSDSVEAGLSLRLEETLVLSVKGEPQSDCRERVAAEDEHSQRYGSLYAKDPADEAESSETCKAMTQINTRMIY